MNKANKFMVIFLSITLSVLFALLYLSSSAPPTQTTSDGEIWHGKQAIEHQTEVKHIEIPGIDILYLKVWKRDPSGRACVCSAVFYGRGRGLLRNRGIFY